LKAKLFLLVLTVVLVAALAGGATMAIFTDTAGNTGNTFAAGTVDIEADRGMGEPLPGPMFFTTLAEGATTPGGVFPHPANVTGPWWPGRTVSRSLEVRNLGSLEVRLNQVSAAIYSINGQPPTANPALAASFAGNMNVKIYVAGHHTAKVLYDGSLATLLTGPRTCVYKPLIAPWVGIFPPAPGGAWPPMAHLVYEVTMDIDAGNDLQGIVPVVSFSVFAEQTKNNP
jgi:predicted ribosomally synthesized peptide with SipW-like signal peptide